MNALAPRKEADCTGDQCTELVHHNHAARAAAAGPNVPCGGGVRRRYRRSLNSRFRNSSRRVRFIESRATTAEPLSHRKNNAFHVPRTGSVAVFARRTSYSGTIHIFIAIVRRQEAHADYNVVGRGGTQTKSDFKKGRYSKDRWRAPTVTDFTCARVRAAPLSPHTCSSRGCGAVFRGAA
jgi:hypothetical protein